MKFVHKVHHTPSPNHNTNSDPMIVDLVIFQEDFYISKSGFARAENWIPYLFLHRSIS